MFPHVQAGFWRGNRVRGMGEDGQKERETEARCGLLTTLQVP